MKTLLAVAVASAAIFITPVSARSLPAEWDGLSRVDAKNFDAAYLAPGANFSAYTKVMLDPAEAAFRRNWLRDYNREQVSLGSRLSDDEARKILEAVQAGIRDVFTEAYSSAGYQVVTTPAPDVIRLKTSVLNLDVTAPEKMTSGRTTTFSRDAGEGTLVLEARDSMSGALLGRGVDRKTIDDAFVARRNSVTNKSDFMFAFKSWAKMSVEAMAKLKALPSITTGPQN